MKKSPLYVFLTNGLFRCNSLGSTDSTGSPDNIGSTDSTGCQDNISSTDRTSSPRYEDNAVGTEQLKLLSSTNSIVHYRSHN